MNFRDLQGDEAIRSCKLGMGYLLDYDTVCCGFVESLSGVEDHETPAMLATSPPMGSPVLG